MDIAIQKRNVKEFIKRWQDRGNEKQDTQRFWIDLLKNVVGVDEPTEYIYLYSYCAYFIKRPY